MARGFKPCNLEVSGGAAMLAVFLLLAVGSTPAAAGGDKPRRCQEITIPMCRGIGYNLTHMPNQFNHDTQVRKQTIRDVRATSNVWSLWTIRFVGWCESIVGSLGVRIIIVDTNWKQDSTNLVDWVLQKKTVL